MTPLLEQAVACIRALPPAEQDRIAHILLAVFEELETGPQTIERLRAIAAKHGLGVARPDAP